MAIEPVIAIGDRMRDEPGPGLRVVLGEAPLQPKQDELAGPALDGGPWRGPSQAAWVTRLLRGAPLPR